MMQCSQPVPLAKTRKSRMKSYIFYSMFTQQQIPPVKGALCHYALRRWLSTHQSANSHLCVWEPDTRDWKLWPWARIRMVDWPNRTSSVEMRLESYDVVCFICPHPHNSNLKLMCRKCVPQKVCIVFIHSKHSDLRCLFKHVSALSEV